MMNERANEIVLRCIEESGVNQTELANRLGIDRRNLNQMLRRGQTIKHEKFAEMLECLGYDLDVQKTDRYKVNPQLASRIADVGEPAGKFWSMSGNAYVGIVNGDSGTETRHFASKDDLMEWLDEA